MRTTNQHFTISFYGPLMDNGDGGSGDNPKDPNNGDTDSEDNGSGDSTE